MNELGPLLLHLVFHPLSQGARKLAIALHHGLNSDAALPGLRIPTILVAEDSSGLPPAAHDLDRAQHSVVVVLADAQMAVEASPLPHGRQQWGAFVAGLAQRCDGQRHLFVPFQLHKNAWPLDDKLSGTSFPPAHFVADGQERDAFVARRLVIELCRFLLGRDRGEQVPVQIFLSHAKADIGEAPRAFAEVVAHLDATKPVETWVDSAKIEAGSQFADAITKGIVKSAAVLALATRNYSTRPWCRREVLLAKEHWKALVVVDALPVLDVRSFPYLGNAPVMPWQDGGAARAVDLLLKELLRQLHTRRVLARVATKDDFILTNSPELATLVRVSKDKPILYPDPPLGDEELAMLSPLGHKLQTPVQRSGEAPALKHKKIALSISESGDGAQYGALPEHLDAALLDLSRSLLVQGASLAYGGHLGKQGYTVALFDLVRAHQERSTLPPVERIVNYVGWPVPFGVLVSEQLAENQRQATYVRVPRPEGVEHLEPQTFVAEPVYFPANSKERRYAWARGMTAMRERQTAETAARIVMGGTIGPTFKVLPDGTKQFSWYSSRIPGVVEEALLTLKANKPLYLCGALGGAAALVIELLEGRSRADFQWDFHEQAPFAPEMRALYQSEKDGFWDYPQMTEFIRSIGVAGLSKVNRLTEGQNRELFWTTDLLRIQELLLSGLQLALAG